MTNGSTHTPSNSQCEVTLGVVQKIPTEESLTASLHPMSEETLTVPVLPPAFLEMTFNTEKFVSFKLLLAYLLLMVSSTDYCFLSG
jgi:hypothetical protein